MIKDISPELIDKAVLVWYDIYPLAYFLKDGESITYPEKDKQPHISDPSAEERRTILFAFQKIGAIKIIHEIGIGKRDTPYRWVFQIINPNFYELEAEFKKIFISKGIGLRINDNNYSKGEELNNWLISQSKDFVDRLWNVIKWLQLEKELVGNNIVKIPYDRYKKNKIDLEEVRKILVNLESKKIISSFYELGRTPPSNDPNKPTGSIGITLKDDEKVFYDTKTEITLNKPFQELYRLLDEKYKTTDKTHVSGPVLTDLTIPSSRAVFFISALQSRFDFFKDEKTKPFFIGLADYTKFIVDHQELERIVDYIKKEEEKDEKKLVELEKVVINDIEQAAKDIFKIIKENKIENAQVKEAVSDYEGLFNGRIQIPGDLTDAKHEALCRIVGSLYETSHKKSVTDYFTETENRVITGYKISPIFYEYQRELNHFRDLRSKTVWGSYDKLLKVYLVYHRTYEGVVGNDPQRQIWLNMSFQGLIDEMETIMKGKPGNVYEFIKDEYKIHAKRVHDYFVEQLIGSTPAGEFEQLGELLKNQTFLSNKKALQTYEKVKTDFERPIIELSKLANISVPVEPNPNNAPRPSQTKNKIGDRIFMCGKLILDLDASTLQYDNHLIPHIQSQNHAIRLLELLILNKNRVVKYEEIHETLDLPGIPLQSKGGSQAIKDIKQELKVLLLEAGMTEEIFKKIIKSDRRVGYKLICE